MWQKLVPMLPAMLCALSLASFAEAEEHTSWIFMPGRYSHHPVTRERVAQYQPLPAVAALPDTRAFASGYHRTRVNLRGADGSIETYYRVESFDNGRGGIDAQWERFNDVWQQSVLAAGTVQTFGRRPRFGIHPGLLPYGGAPYGSPVPYGGYGGGYGGGFGGYGTPGAAYPGGAPATGYPGAGPNYRRPGGRP